jgi:F-box protein 21
MDPFRTSAPVPVSSLHEQINFLARNPNPVDHTAFLAGSNAREIVVRCARNILNSIRHSIELPSSRPIDHVSAQYAALWALVILPDSLMPLATHLMSHMRLFINNFQYDASLIEKYILRPTADMQTNYAELCRSVRMTDLHAPRTVKRRSGNPDAEGVKFKVGQVFLHKRYSYTAVVTGWDAKCDADEEWIQRMGVDISDRGRRQAFYHAL